MPTNEEDKFINYLKKNRLSCSQTRLTIFKLIFSIHRHFEVEEILSIIKKKKLSISRATLYRNLALLEKAEFIRKVQFTDRHSHYEHIMGHEHHEHLICQNCGKIVDFYKQSIERSLEEMAKEYGFKQLSHKLEIIGLCEKCR